MTRLWPKGQAIRIWGEEDAPLGFVWAGATHRIDQVCNRWQVHTRWWESSEVVWREYWKVTTEGGFLCLLYRDLIGGGWFLSRLYD